MATREENLKKIKAELEAMSDDELSMVAGGSKTETANDSRFLNSLNGSCDRYGEYKIGEPADWGYRRSEIRDAWKTVGIDFRPLYDNQPNEYYLDGQQITQEAARQHAMKVTGHYMTEKDWKW